MGQRESVIIPKSYLYDKIFQKYVNIGFYYIKKKRKWWKVLPPPRKRQNFIYK